MALAHQFDIIKYLNPNEFCKLTNKHEWFVTRGGECDRSGIGVAEVLSKFNMKQIKFNPDLDISSIIEIDKAIKKIHNKNFNTLRVSTGPHQFFIEVNGKSIRILSLYGDRHGFYDYFKYSKFGKYFEIDGDTYNEMIGYFNDIIEFKPRNEGHMPQLGELKPIFENPEEGEAKMNKAINAWIALFGVRYDGIPINTDAEYGNDLVRRYTSLMPYDGEALGYQKYEMNSDVYHQLRIRNHREVALPGSEEDDDDLKVSAGGRKTRKRKTRRKRKRKTKRKKRKTKRKKRKRKRTRRRR